MKAQILISGSISSVAEIRRNLHNYNSVNEGRFGSLTLYYRTLTAARKDLAAAWREIKAAGCVNSFDGLFGGEVLRYDAAEAAIERL